MHLYSIASPKANRWTGMMIQRFLSSRSPKWEFRPDPESSNLRNPKILIRIVGQGQEYLPTNAKPVGRRQWDFGLVLRGPSPIDAHYMFMAMAGRSSLGTEAACLATTDPDCARKLLMALRFKGIDPDDHKAAFCAVVSMECDQRGFQYGYDPQTFQVPDVVAY